MFDIHGNTDGIRNTVLGQIQQLYDMPVGKDEYLPRDSILFIAQVSAAVNREVSLYLSREGDVLDITVGNTDSVPLQSWHMRRNASRLSRVRCIHTHPGGSALLSDVDLSALRSLMLDSICSVGVSSDGHITGIQCAYLGPKTDEGRSTTLTEVLPLQHFPQQSMMDMIAAAEQLVDAERDSAAPDARERALLIGTESDKSLDELASLADSAGAEVVGRVLQKKTKPDPATFIGSGKAERLQLDAQALDADLIIADDELTGIQTRNLEQLTGLKVVDRTTLILDIFAQRARSSEGKLQVSLAQLKYRSARLIGQGLILSRLGGGIGTRGPGESKLEIDRRRIRTRITELRRELDKMVSERELRRRNREKSRIPTVALVGYTNTGKSSLLNRLTDANVYVECRLFATLDAVSRRVSLPDGGEFILTDTVGFISKLPHDLVDAFRSTLEEAACADVLVIVNDMSDPDMLARRQVVDEVLRSLGAGEQTRIEVLNKCDLPPATEALPGAIPVSAATGQGLDVLLAAIAAALRTREQKYTVLVPFSKYRLLSELHRSGRVTEEKHTEEGTEVTVWLDSEKAGRFSSQQLTMRAQSVSNGDC